MIVHCLRLPNNICKEKKKSIQWIVRMIKWEKKRQKQKKKKANKKKNIFFCKLKIEGKESEKRRKKWKRGKSSGLTDRIWIWYRPENLSRNDYLIQVFFFLFFLQPLLNTFLLLLVYFVYKSLFNLFVHLSVHLFIYSVIDWLHSFIQIIHSFVHLFVCSIVHLFICSFIECCLSNRIYILYVCVCVCVCVCRCVSVCVGVSVYQCVSMYQCVSVYVGVCGTVLFELAGFIEINK